MLALHTWESLGMRAFSVRFSRGPKQPCSASRMCLSMLSTSAVVTHCWSRPRPRNRRQREGVFDAMGDAFAGDRDRIAGGSAGLAAGVSVLGYRRMPGSWGCMELRTRHLRGARFKMSHYPPCQHKVEVSGSLPSRDV